MYKCLLLYSNDNEQGSTQEVKWVNTTERVPPCDNCQATTSTGYAGALQCKHCFMMLCRTCAEAHKTDCTFKDGAVKKHELESDNDEETDDPADPPSSDEAPDASSAAEEADHAGAESEASVSQAPSKNKTKES